MPFPSYHDLVNEVTDAVLAREGRWEGGEIRFTCASGEHEDRHPSARWNPEKGTWFCDVCKIGGGAKDLAERLGLISDWRDRSRSTGAAPHHSADQPPSGKPGRIAATYGYRGADGALLFQVVRLEPKNFRQRRPDGRGGWEWNLEGVPLVLYRLPELLAEPGQPVWVCEGEKDADRLASVGLLATTAPGGAGKWRPEYTEVLTGRNIAVVPDNDEPGARHAQRVAHALHGRAASVRVVKLPGLPTKGDVSDWLDAGHTADELRELARRTPEWEPPVTPEPPSNGQREVIVTSLANIQPRAVDWLWRGWLPCGKLALLAGSAGDGKSTIAIDLAARFSVGSTLPDGTRAPRVNSLILAAEDDAADTVRPRLDLHRGDPRRVFVITAVRDGDRERALSLTEHIPELRYAIAANDIKFVVIDPLSAFLPRADRNSEGDVRDALMPLVALAQETGVAVLGIVHLSKPTPAQRKPLERLLGSVAFGALARAVWMTAELPSGQQGVADEEPEGRRMVLGVIKSNLAIKPKPLAWTRPLDAPIFWLGASEVSVEDALQGDPEGRPIEVAVDFLREILKGGMRPASEVEREAAEAGISRATLKRARATLGVKAIKDRTGRDGRWYLTLPFAGASEEPAAPLEAHLPPIYKSEPLIGDDSSLSPALEAHIEKVRPLAESSEESQFTESEPLIGDDSASALEAHFYIYTESEPLIGDGDMAGIHSSGSGDEWIDVEPGDGAHPTCAMCGELLTTAEDIWRGACLDCWNSLGDPEPAPHNRTDPTPTQGGLGTEWTAAPNGSEGNDRWTQ